MVVRLEGLGTFALPRAVLDGHRVPLCREPSASSDPIGPGGTSMGAVPVILREDFLHGATSRRRDLVVDTMGCVRHEHDRPLPGPG